MAQNRLIFYHKQHTSARLRFLKFASGSTCAFGPMTGSACTPNRLRSRAATARVNTNGGPVQVYLAELTTTDPPFDRAAVIDAESIGLTQARDPGVVELELLRLAYEYVMQASFASPVEIYTTETRRRRKGN